MTLWATRWDLEPVGDPLYLIERCESFVPFRKVLAMVIEVAASDKEALDDRVWIIIRG